MSAKLNKGGRWQGPLAGFTAAIILGAAFEFAPPSLFPQAHADESQTAQSAPLSTPTVGPVSFADVVAKARPAVVNITVTEVQESSAVMPQQFRQTPGGSPFDQFFQRFFEYQQQQQQQQQPRRLEGQGSGFVIDPAGYIVTNNHVISDADKIVVTFQNGDKLDAKLIGHDPKTDLALIKVNASHPLKSISFGDSEKARIGDWVLAIGNPFGLGGTATAGIISARGRNLHPARPQESPYDDYLQVDAPINPGNSGGPLLNTKGQVIGINSAIYSPNGGNVGIGFAIPSDQAASIIAQLKNGGKVVRGWLGLQIQTVTEDLAKSLGLDHAEGALVSKVVSGSPAAEAGFQTGDVVQMFGNEKVDSARTLSRVVSEHQPGDSIKVDVLRNGQARELAVHLGNAASNEAVAASSDGTATPESLGLTLAPLDGQTRAQLGLPQGVNGVVVSSVDPDGPAADKGLRPGDVITEINQRPVGSVGAAVAALKQAKQAGSNALVLIRRGDSQYFVAMKLS